MELEVKIKNIRNIKNAELELPLEKGLYCIVGENGCGKSTLMLIMSLMVKTSSAHMLTKEDIATDSTIDITTEKGTDHWYYKNGKMTTGVFTYVKRGGSTKHSHSALCIKTHYPGFYEGSIFYGSRFNDYDCIDSFISDARFEKNIVPADQFVSETLGYILHNDKNYYNSLYTVKNKKTSEEFNFKGRPYFLKCGSSYISQFKMSSGECMLISLINFINTIIINYPRGGSKAILLIDEVELALHPSAIDRLVLFLEGLLKKSKQELIICFSTHSAELIHRISAKRIYLLENNNGVLTTENPCYPNYAIRNLYIPNGFDFVLLVEDELAKALVEKVLLENNLKRSKLCCVLPAGGCHQMLKLHHDMVTYNTLGVGKHIISIYDGDVKDGISSKSEYCNLQKCFLPIPSIEKYLQEKLLVNPDRTFIKLIGDKYFNQRSLNDIIKDYEHDDRTKKNNKTNGKVFYDILISNLESNGMQERDFIKYLCDDIYAYEKPTSFVRSLTKLLS